MKKVRATDITKDNYNQKACLEDIRPESDTS